MVWNSRHESKECCWINSIYYLLKPENALNNLKSAGNMRAPMLHSSSQSSCSDVFRISWKRLSDDTFLFSIPRNRTENYESSRMKSVYKHLLEFDIFVEHLSDRYCSSGRGVSN